MSRAFILLPRERRVDQETRARILSERNEAAFEASDVDKPLITTTAKVITWLSALIVIVISLSGWAMSSRFENIVEGRFDKFELRLTREYAAKADTLTKTEYELRHAELSNSTKQLSERVTEDERRITELERMVLQNGNGSQTRKR